MHVSKIHTYIHVHVPGLVDGVALYMPLGHVPTVLSLQNFVLCSKDKGSEGHLHMQKPYTYSGIREIPLEKDTANIGHHNACSHEMRKPKKKIFFFLSYLKVEEIQ